MNQTVHSNFKAEADCAICIEKLQEFVTFGIQQDKNTLSDNINQQEYINIEQSCALTFSINDDIS